jgi:flagellar protein FlbB
MASFGRTRVLGRAIVLFLLILVLGAGGLVWFDYLGLLDLKDTLGPVYRGLGIAARGKAVIPAEAPALLDEERMQKRLESLQTRTEDLDKREAALSQKDADILQKVQEIDDRNKALDDREKSFNEKVKQYDNRKVNIDQNAKYLVGMTPKNAVAILLGMDDQLMIDTLRSVEAQAKAEGTDSIVSYWLSLMPADRSSVIQRKMAAKPESLEQ